MVTEERRLARQEMLDELERRIRSSEDALAEIKRNRRTLDELGARLDAMLRDMKEERKEEK